MKQRIRALVALAAAGGAALAFAAPAQAGLLVKSATNCPVNPAATKVFAPWLDIANYIPAPGGAAESAAGWTLAGGARIVPGNEPWKVGGSTHSNSLLLPKGSSATTGVMCVGVEYPTMRFFAKRSGGTLLSTLLIEVEFEGLGGVLRRLPVGVVLNGGRWQPTLPHVVLASLLPLLPGQRTPVRFRFTPVGGGSWNIDDVYVDPWRIR
jgi:hypothetical protein